MQTLDAAPIAPDNDGRVDRILERDLFGARSVVGALVVLALLCFFGFGLQAIDDAVKNASSFAVGQPEHVSDTVAFTPAAGWIEDPALSNPGSGIVANKNGWELKVAVGLQLQPGQSLEDFSTIFHDIPPAEADAQVSDLETFTTTSGLHGVRWEVHSTSAVYITYQIASGTDITQVLASGSPNTLSSLQEEIDAMVASITMGASS